MLLTVDMNVIGMIIKEPNNLELAMGYRLEERHFENKLCALVYRKCVELHKNQIPIDMMQVCGAMPIGDVSEIVNWVTHAPLAQSFTHHVQLLLHNHWKTETALRLSQLSTQVMKSDVTEAQKLSTEISGLGDQKAHSNFEGVWANEISAQFIDEIEERVSRVGSGGKRGLETGFSTLNGVFGGWVPGRLYILAARTSIGKTTLAVNLTAHILKQNKHAYFFTNEMTELSIFEKMVSSLGKLHGAKLETGVFSREETDRLVDVVKELHQRPWCINHKAGRYIETFEAECRRLKKQDKLDFVVLDYIQQMGIQHVKGYQTKQQSLTYVSDRLKKLALDLQVPILALAQINREGESDDAAPSLAHIKDSGSIEQDADAVIILHRKRSESDGIANLVVAKNRFGKTGAWEIRSDLVFNQFVDM